MKGGPQVEPASSETAYSILVSAPEIVPIHATTARPLADFAIVVSCWCTLPAAPETVVPFPLSAAVLGIDASDAHAAHASTATVVKILMRRR